MLKVLPANISNLIAAGEVVNRPASVVKELVENAIDAGADSVDVAVLDAGRTLIRVSDNGCGMTADEATLCFERHATSKISSAEDLEKIMTYGFRGEALASIAAVSQVTLKTRQKGAPVGVQVEAADSKIISCEEAAVREGTSFEVRNLFYNVPARRKFLKSDNVEMRNLVQEFLRVALTRTSISLKLKANGKDVYDLRPAANLKQRIHDIYGMNMANELVPVEVDTSVVKISGFIGNPQDAHKRSGNQFFFVNGRYFRSPFFHKAVCKPYEKLIPDEYVPSYFIYMEINPELVDVNIHPSKTEVKFEDDGLIFEILLAAVREALGKNDFTPSIDFDVPTDVQIPVFDGKGLQSYSIRQPKIDYEPLFNPFEQKAPAYAPAAPSAPYPAEGLIFDEHQAQAHDNCIVIQKKYVATPVKSGLMVINIERAWRRVYYERYYERIAEEQPVAQQTLFPLTFKMSAEDCLTLLEQPDLLERLGFDVRDFGNSSVVVYGVPEGCPLDEEGVRMCLDNLIAGLTDTSSLDDYRHILAVKMAESAAASCRKSFKSSEAQMLVDQLFACREPNLDPEGKACLTIIPVEDLDKRL